MRYTNSVMLISTIHELCWDIRVNQRITVYNNPQKYLDPEEVLHKMYREDKILNLNSPLDKGFIESNWDRWRDEIVDVLTDRQKISDFIKSLDRKGTGIKFLAGDINVLVNELNRLLGSFVAGNNNTFNEIAAKH